MKVKGLSIITGFVAALLFTITLRFFKLFDFIKWDPIGYSDKLNILTSSKGIVKWIILFLFIWIICIILYYFSFIFMKMPVAISSLMVGIILAVAVEWLIMNDNTLIQLLKIVSIPFICIVTISLRFVMEAAIFHIQDQPLSK
jgi:hypothetical protein